MPPISSPAERGRQLRGESCLTCFRFDMRFQHAIANM
jgi:hypothetical protein